MQGQPGRQGARAHGPCIRCHAARRAQDGGVKLARESRCKRGGLDAQLGISGEREAKIKGGVFVAATTASRLGGSGQGDDRAADHRARSAGLQAVVVMIDAIIQRDWVSPCPGIGGGGRQCHPVAAG